MPTSQELADLRLFVVRAEELRTSRLVQKGGNVGFTFSWDRTTGLDLNVRQPAEDDLRSVLLTLRQFMADREPIHLFRIYKLLDRSLGSDVFRNELRAARKAWKERLRAGPIKLVVNEEEWTPEHVADLWINGWYFHNDHDKRRELERIWPAELVRYCFVDFIIEALKQVLFTAGLIRRILGEGLLS